MKELKIIPDYTRALEFAAFRHRNDKTRSGEPYINHILTVCGLLSNAEGPIDNVLLMAAALHDTIEKTDTRANEINMHFGEQVFQLVLEVTDHAEAENESEKFNRQLERIGNLSQKARLLKLADKTANVQAYVANPESMEAEKRNEYLRWSEKIVEALRGTSKSLEQIFDELIAAAKKNQLYIPDYVQTT